ncbi:MAG: hypothetical protein HY892_21655 [Deltaproteobacteria bacterium]|nr:hypothetical protein [Deltaproteobacteria bacterium]
MKTFRFFGVLGLTISLFLTACAPPKKVISGYEFPSVAPPVEKTPAVSGTAEEIKRLEALIRQMEETEKKLKATQRTTEEALRRIEEASRKTEDSVHRLQKAQDKIEAVGNKQGP